MGTYRKAVVPMGNVFYCESSQLDDLLFRLLGVLDRIPTSG
jgi:hypothetical protein